jgi:hypothetical protein
VRKPQIRLIYRKAINRFTIRILSSPDPLIRPKKGDTTVTATQSDGSADDLLVNEILEHRIITSIAKFNLYATFQYLTHAPTKSLVRLMAQRSNVKN